MKKSLTILFIALTTSIFSFAQKPDTIPLWPSGVPESNGITEAETNVSGSLSFVSVPSMTVYPADQAKNSGAAILICPGGGYTHEASLHEGSQIAEWFASNGITAFVLKYRLPNGHSFIPLKDAQQAMRIIRQRSAEWKVNPAKVGVTGFSAGGHLASTLGTHFDASCRPDFMILFYPVVTMDEAITHKGSRTNLLGKTCSKDSVNYYSNERQVSPQTPHTLIFLSDNDGAVPPQNSIDFYLALKENKVPASMYIFPEGGHGWGFRNTFRYHESWKGLCLDWLKFEKIL